MITLEIKDAIRRTFTSCKRQFEVRVSLKGIDSDTIETYAMNYLIWAEQRHVRDDLDEDERIELANEEYSKHYSEMGAKVVSKAKLVDQMDKETAAEMFRLLEAKIANEA